MKIKKSKIKKLNITGDSVSIEEFKKEINSLNTGLEIDVEMNDNGFSCQLKVILFKKRSNSFVLRDKNKKSVQLEIEYKNIINATKSEDSDAEQSDFRLEMKKKGVINIGWW